MVIKSNFPLANPQPAPAAQPQGNEFRARALESISGSMVFVEDALVWWDIEDE